MTDEQIKSRFAEAGDFVTRTLRCGGNPLYAYYIDGLTSGGDISEYVFKPVSENLSGSMEVHRMELIEKLKKQLSEEYGIHSDQELMDAIAHQKPIDIGVFVKEVNGIEKAS